MRDSDLDSAAETIAGAGALLVAAGAGMRLTSESLVSSHGASLIRVNPREAQVPRGQIGIAAPALEALREIDRRLG